MEIYEITVKDKSSRRTINRALVDDLEVRGEFLRLYLKGIYVTAYFIPKTVFSVVDLNSKSGSSLLLYYLRYKNKVAKMIRDGDKMIAEWKKEEGNAERDPADSPIIWALPKEQKRCIWLQKKSGRTFRTLSGFSISLKNKIKKVLKRY